MPGVPSRMKESRRFLRERIDTREVWSLVPITKKTGERQITGNTLPTVNRGNDVVNLKCQSVIRLWHLAVFTGRLCASPNEFNELLIHEWLKKLDHEV